MSMTIGATISNVSQSQFLRIACFYDDTAMFKTAQASPLYESPDFWLGQLCSSADNSASACLFGKTSDELPPMETVELNFEVPVDQSSIGMAYILGSKGGGGPLSKHSIQLCRDIHNFAVDVLDPQTIRVTGERPGFTTPPPSPTKAKEGSPVKGTTSRRMSFNLRKHFNIFAC